MTYDRAIIQCDTVLLPAGLSGSAHVPNLSATRSGLFANRNSRYAGHPVAVKTEAAHRPNAATPGLHQSGTHDRQQYSGAAGPIAMEFVALAGGNCIRNHMVAGWS